MSGDAAEENRARTEHAALSRDDVGRRPCCAQRQVSGCQPPAPAPAGETPGRQGPVLSAPVAGSLPKLAATDR